MPELPEVETIRRDIEPHTVGRTIRSLRVTERRMVRRSPSPASVETAATGQRIVALDRRGKFLLFRLAEPNGTTLALHFGMSGAAIYCPDLNMAAEHGENRHVHVRMELDNDTALLVRDPRMFGEIFISEDIESTLNLGPEPLSKEFSPELLKQKMQSRASVKGALLDQRRIAGLGNIYVDESLFIAGLHPLRKADSLTGDDLKRLHAAIVGVLSQAIENRGSTIGTYMDAYGEKGSMQDSHQIYGHEGKCGRCGDEIKRIKVAGRSSFYCAGCQK